MGWTIVTGGVITDLPAGLPVGLQLVARAVSDATAQEPSATNTPEQVSYGAGFGGPTSPIEILADGTQIFHEDFLGYVVYQFQFGRAGSGGVAELIFRSVADINDGNGFSVQAGDGVHASLPNAGTNIPASFTLPLVAQAGFKLKQEVIRDGSGANEGGFYGYTPSASAIVPAVGISPAATILFFKLVTV